jgi:hypothetical protein
MGVAPPLGRPGKLPAAGGSSAPAAATGHRQEPRFPPSAGLTGRPEPHPCQRAEPTKDRTVVRSLAAVKRASCTSLTTDGRTRGRAAEPTPERRKLPQPRRHRKIAIREFDLLSPRL